MNILEGDNMRTIQEAQQELLVKVMRVAYWEKNHSIPTMSDLEGLEEEVLI